MLGKYFISLIDSGVMNVVSTCGRVSSNRTTKSSTLQLKGELRLEDCKNTEWKNSANAVAFSCGSYRVSLFTLNGGMGIFFLLVDFKICHNDLSGMLALFSLLDFWFLISLSLFLIMSLRTFRNL